MRAEERPWRRFDVPADEILGSVESSETATEQTNAAFVYDSHDKRTNPEIRRPQENSRPAEVQATNEAAAATREPLAGLSAAKTEFFNELRESLARFKLALAINPDGEMFTGEDSVESLGNIHDEKHVAKLIGMFINPEHEEIVGMMHKLFPESTNLGFLYEGIRGRRLQPKKHRKRRVSKCKSVNTVVAPERTPTVETSTVSALRPYDPTVNIWTHEVPAECQIDTEFITGSAGTGKTYEVQRRSAADPDGVILAATTGIAAVNLGPQVTTVHSLLKFFNYNSLLEAYDNGRMQSNIRALVDGGMRELIVDEISMFSAPAMDVLYKAFNEVAWDHPAIKLTLVGDFCQLPPIAYENSPGTDRYAFEADCWRPHFSEHTTRLQAARRGAGEEALAHLQTSGALFQAHLIDDFDGTTLCATNENVDIYNRRRLLRLPGGGNVRESRSTRWGEQTSESRNIPDRLHLKIGAYVMILSNDSPSFRWVNGDCGAVVEIQGNAVVVRLKRNNAEVLIGEIVRKRTTRTRPPRVPDTQMIVLRNEAEYNEMVRTDREPPRQIAMVREPRPMWITGWVKYYPLRLAYATTVHKSQGLSLDAIQLDLSSNFLAHPAMMYVALSRCRTPGGLVLVGNPEHVVTKTQVDPRVVEWL